MSKNNCDCFENYLENYLKEQEENKWKKEKRFEDFLEYLLELVEREHSISSDIFCYNEEKVTKYTSSEFEKLFHSLSEKVDEYGSKNFIKNDFNIDSSDYFTTYSYCIKIKDKFYKICSISGQGTYIYMSLINEEIEKDFIDYELMMNDEPDTHYKENVENYIKEKIEELLNDLATQDIPTDMLLTYLRNYFNKLMY